MQNTSMSDRDLFLQAQNLLPGGVNSPVRAYGSVGGDPVFIQSGHGAYVLDRQGRRYIDFVCSYGPHILGHSPENITRVIAETAAQGTCFGAATELEVRMAEKVSSHVPSVEMMRFVNSGTEATMSALRVARGFTGRTLMVKFAGCYHGHGDAFLSEAGSGVATLGIPGCAGVPEGVARDTITVPYNNIEAFTDVMRVHGANIAAVFVEPIACNMGMVLPADGFLQTLRKLCDQHGALLVFDEVITGFRVGLGGAQAMFDVRPDLTTFGKIIGGGLPVGAYGGRRDIMNMIAPIGPVYQAGTLSGNSLAMAAGLAMLETLETPDFYPTLEARTARFCNKLRAVLAQHGRTWWISQCASIFHLWPKNNATHAPANYTEIKQADAHAFTPLFLGLLKHGVMIAPSAFEVGFVSNAHIDAILDEAIQAFAKALET